MNVLSLIQNNIRSLATAPAISFRENGVWKSLTWSEFGKELARTINALKSIGVKKQDKVGLYSANSKDWILVDLATQMLGGVAVPIYATNSQEQTAFIIKQTQIKAILVGDLAQLNILREIKKEADFQSVQVISSVDIETPTDTEYYFPKWRSVYEDVAEYEEVLDDDVSTILYTSGTTGMPKGVVLAHENFAAVVEAHKDFFNIENLHGKKSLAFLPLSHIFEKAWTSFFLSQGGEVAILDNPKEVSQALKEVKPWAMCSVPRLYEKIYQLLLGKINTASATKQKLFRKALEVGMKYAEKKRKGETVPFFLNLQYQIFSKLVFNKIKNELGGNLGFMPVGGAMLKKEIAEFFEAIGLPIIVGYGLTETCATVTAYPSKNYIHGSVGVPLKGVDVKIGEQNEILVKYKGVMKGYYNNPDETAKVFTEDGYFRTGDAGRLDENGNLYIIDRIKDLMKTSNGKYIAPQSIELPLQTHPSISQALIVAEGKPYVTSFIVPNFENLVKDWEEFKDYVKMNINEKMQLLEMPNIKEKFQKIIDEVQKNQSPFEKIKKFTLLPEEFTIEKGELTPTLKIKRRVVMDKLKLQIESFYKD
ncbi:MAG: long-chain fatty acid--CoA ligase [Flavobacteriaceae bacterium]|nr:long-chain fatty acid--CoA ligase [Flavobacteriaceae bacterium]